MSIFWGIENFLQDCLDFLWDYWKLKFSQEKSRQICLRKNNGGCPFLGVAERFLSDFQSFCKIIWNWNFHRKKDKFLYEQLQRQPFLPIKNCSPYVLWKYKYPKVFWCWEIHKKKICEIYFDSPFIVVSLLVVWYYLQETLWVFNSLYVEYRACFTA